MNIYLSKDISLDPELHHITKHMFYHIVPIYIRTYEQKKYDKIIRVTLFHNIYLMLEWKKVFKKYHLTTSYLPQPDYTLSEDDLKFITFLNEYFTPKNVKWITEWYARETKERNKKIN